MQLVPKTCGSSFSIEFCLDKEPLGSGLGLFCRLRLSLEVVGLAAVLERGGGVSGVGVAAVSSPSPLVRGSVSLGATRITFQYVHQNVNRVD